MSPSALSPSSQDTQGCHFTYCRPASEDLQQGDLISKTEEIKPLLKEHHPYYLDDSYTHFLILTQSCDLVRRNGNICKSRFVSLASVCSLANVLNHEIRICQDEFMKKAQVSTLKERHRLHQYLERLLNNNAPTYFYLHEDVSLNLYDSSCALLDVTFTLPSKSNYDILMKSRLLSLSESFQAKLGWLTGNLYSRVATEDWVPVHLKKADFSNMIKDLLDGSCKFFEDEQIRIAQKECEANGIEDTKALQDAIQAKKIKSKKDRVLDRVVSILKESGDFDEHQAVKLRSRLQNDTEITQSLK